MKWRSISWRAWAFTALAVGLAAGAYAVFHVTDVRRSVVGILPPDPDVSMAHPELRERLARAQREAQTGWRPVRALSELAILYEANGFYAEARQVYAGLVRVDSSNPRWPHLLAGILAGFGQLEEALPLLRRTVVLDPGYLPARIRLGDAFLKTNRAEEAAHAYRAVLEQDASNAYAQLGLARIDMEAGEWHAARDRLQRLVASQPSFGSAWFLLRTIDEQLSPGTSGDRAIPGGGGRFREMPDPWTDELLRDCYDVYRLRVVSEAAAKAGDTTAAQRWLERALLLDPADATAQRQLGNLFVQTKSYALARRHLQRAVELAPDDADNWNYMIALLNTVGDEPAAERAVVEGLARCPLSPSLHYERGRRLSAAGRLNEAVAELKEAHRLRPEAANAIVELAMIDFRLNQVEAGVAKLRTALASEPSHPLALIALAQDAINTGDVAGARALLRRARQQPKVLAQDLSHLAGAFEQKFGSSPW